MTLLVSLIIATYNSGGELERLVASLDAQTLPQDQFEAIFVDDGSTNDTFSRLQGFAATRPNYQVERIENSGWPSRPRNIGMRRARGVYVTFMDHDDELFPDGLRAVTEYARTTGADVVIPHEEKTNDMWMFLPALECGNAVDIEAVGGFSRMFPMVPHKLYRRALLIENSIQFPEMRRALWEDQYVNLAAYRHAQRISLLADAPYYHWRTTAANTSLTFSPRKRHYWERLDDIMTFAADTLAGPEFASARTAALEKQIHLRVLDKFVGQWNPYLWDSWRAGRLSRSLLAKFLDDDVFESLPVRHRILASLLERGKFGAMAEFDRFDRSIRVHRRLREVRVDSTGFHGEFVVDWARADAGSDLVREEEGVLRLAVPKSLRRLLPAALLDVTDSLAPGSICVAIRNRLEPITWIPEQREELPVVTRSDEGGAIIRTSTNVAIDPTRAAFGRPIGPGVWNVRARTELFGIVRKDAVPYRDGPVPFAIGGDFAVAYASNKGGLTIDNAGALRTFATDAMGTDPIAFSHPDVDVRLPLAVGTGDGEMDAALIAVPIADGWNAAQGHAPVGHALSVRVVNGGGDCRLVGSIDLPAGDYEVWAIRAGEEKKTARVLSIEAGGSATIR